MSAPDGPRLFWYFRTLSRGGVGNNIILGIRRRQSVCLLCLGVNILHMHGHALGENNFTCFIGHGDTISLKGSLGLYSDDADQKCPRSIMTK